MTYDSKASSKEILRGTTTHLQVMRACAAMKVEPDIIDAGWHKSSRIHLWNDDGRTICGTVINGRQHATSEELVTEPRWCPNCLRELEQFCAANRMPFPKRIPHWKAPSTARRGRTKGQSARKTATNQSVPRFQAPGQVPKLGRSTGMVPEPTLKPIYEKVPVPEGQVVRHYRYYMLLSEEGELEVTGKTEAQAEKELRRLVSYAYPRQKLEDLDLIEVKP